MDERDGDIESGGMLGGELERMDQVDPTLEPDGGIFSGLDISQEEKENCKPFADICWECLVEINILG